MPGFHTSESETRRLREERAEASKPTNARDEAKRVLEALQRGESVDLELLADMTLVDVMAHGEDKDRVNASRALKRPRKAKEEPEEDDRAPSWLANPEASKPVVVTESTPAANGVAPPGQDGAH